VNVDNFVEPLERVSTPALGHSSSSVCSGGRRAVGWRAGAGPGGGGT
jgi:hypothetical protein